MEVGHFTAKYPTSVILEQLPLADQSDLRERLQSLSAVSPSAWPEKFVKKMPDDPSLYLLLVNGTWRAFLRASEGEQPEVIDLVRREVLELFANSKT